MDSVTDYLLDLPPEIIRIVRDYAVDYPEKLARAFAANLNNFSAITMNMTITRHRDRGGHFPVTFATDMAALVALIESAPLQTTKIGKGDIRVDLETLTAAFASIWFIRKIADALMDSMNANIDRVQHSGDEIVYARLTRVTNLPMGSLLAIFKGAAILRRENDSRVSQIPMPEYANEIDDDIIEQVLADERYFREPPLNTFMFAKLAEHNFDLTRGEYTLDTGVVFQGEKRMRLNGCLRCNLPQ